MKSLSRPLMSLCGAALFASALGCGLKEATDRQRAINDLKQVLLAYHHYVDANSKPPASQAEMSGWAAKMAPEAVPLINDTRWTVLWGAHPGKQPGGSGNAVLAHGPTTGADVIVGMADGSVKRMTINEFNAATKAK